MICFRQNLKHHGVHFDHQPTNQWDQTQPNQALPKTASQTASTCGKRTQDPRRVGPAAPGGTGVLAGLGPQRPVVHDGHATAWIGLRSAESGESGEERVTWGEDQGEETTSGRQAQPNSFGICSQTQTLHEKCLLTSTSSILPVWVPSGRARGSCLSTSCPVCLGSKGS